MSRRFRNLLLGSTAGTLVLMLAGLYTGIYGAGLTCGRRWPFCDGWLGLFPANWMSFIEWFHRLLAMLIGIALLVTLYAAWRRQSDRRVAWAVTAAVAVLPSQIILGALTVTEFTALIMAAHFTTASFILLCLTAACAWTVETPSLDRLHRLGLVAVAAVPVHLAFDGSLVAVSPAVLMTFYAVSFLLAGGLAAGALWAHERDLDRVRLLFSVGAAVTWLDTLVARRLFDLPQVLTDVGALVVLAVVLVAVRVLSNRPPDDGLAAIGAD